MEEHFIKENKVCEKSSTIVSVIIPSKRKGLLQYCLSSLERQTYPLNLIDVIVVSPENYVEENIWSFPIRNVVRKELNQAQARNIAESIARGDILAFCDDDCILQPDWIKNALKHFSDRRVATVGGPSIPPLENVSFSEMITGLLMMSFLGTGAHRKAYVLDAETSARLCKPVEIICANMFVDRNKFREVGGFDGVVPQEEDRLNTKFLKMGYKIVYDPKCYNIHYQRPWGPKAVKNFFWLMVGQGALTAIRRRPSSMGYLIPPLFVIGLMINPLIFSSTLLKNLYLIFALVYMACVLFETLHLIFKNRNKLSNFQRLAILITLPFIFFIHHVSSGLGFLFGFIRQLLRGKRVIRA